MNSQLLHAFWNCGDNDIIEFAILRARLNAREKDVLVAILDECLTQEETAERLGYSVRRVQQIWRTGSVKILSIPWVRAYSRELTGIR